jgi:hypothetical protein
MRQRANFCSLFNASVPQALAKRMRQRAGEPISASSPNADVPKALAQWMRQRQGACFCSLFNASVPQAPAQWMRQRQGADFCPILTPAFLKHQRNGYASVTPRSNFV